MDNIIGKEIFNKDIRLYKKLVTLNDFMKDNKLKIKKTIFIEFTGTPRAGKTSVINIIEDFLKKYKYNVKIADEEKIKPTKSVNKNPSKKQSVNSLDYTKNVIEEKVRLFSKYSKNSKYDFIFFDRGINDEFVWLETFDATDKELVEYNKKLVNMKVDFLFILTCDEIEALKRKHYNSLSLLPNKWTNYEVLNKYNKGLEETGSYFNNHADKIIKINTSNKKVLEVALDIINNIINKL